MTAADYERIAHYERWRPFIIETAACIIRQLGLPCKYIVADAVKSVVLYEGNNCFIHVHIHNYDGTYHILIDKDHVP